MPARIIPMAMICAAIISMAILGSPMPTLAQDGFTPVYQPSLNVQRAAGQIKVDGWLEDAGWEGAAKADNFVENQPGDQIKPPVETEAFMTYDDEYLYVAIVAYDNPADVRASLCERDRVYGDDNVGFFIDTYGDASWAYTLNVNPYGVQADALWTNGFGEDSKYDLIWESAGQITKDGYQVELAIPFTSLRFPNKDVQTWKVEFWRHHQRDVHHNISWCAYDRDETCWACQWGSITGVENVKPGRGIEIMPALTGFQAGSLMEGNAGRLNFDNQDADGEIALNGKYSIGSNVTAEMTFNPDFSQVEADANQIDVNSTTALSFPEKRPFFQEGSDLFRSLYDVVYTRSINDPAFAAKATARFGRTSLAYLGAYDEHSPIIVPFEEFSTPVLLRGKSTSNLLKFKQTFGDNSHFGLLATDRRFEGGGAGSAISLDGTFRFSKYVKLQWQAIATHTEEPDDTSFTAAGWMDQFDSDTLTNLNTQFFDDEHTAGFDGESFWGHGYIGILGYDASNLYMSLRYSETSPTFRLDNGYEPNNNRRYGSFNTSYTFRFDEGLFESISVSANPATVWNTDGLVKDEWIYFNLSTNWRRSQISTHSQYLINNERYAGTWYGDVWEYHQCLHATPSKAVSVGGNVNIGDRIARRAQTMGRQLSTGMWLDLRPSDRIYWENWYNYIQSRSKVDDEMLYKGFTVRSRLNLQFNRELSLRFVVQYSDFSETWDFDPLLTYRINPFTMFYIGTTYDYGRLEGLTDDKNAYLPDGDPGPGCSATKLCSRQFFMKLQYLFQL